MRAFIDANVLVAILNKEFPVFNSAARIFSLPANKFKLYTSPVCLAIAFYFAEKKCGSKRAKEKLELLCRYFEIADADKQVVQNALLDKRISDFEDGVEYYAALSGKCDVIITEDTSDFSFSDIEVHTSKGFIDAYYDKLVKMTKK